MDASFGDFSADCCLVFSRCLTAPAPEATASQTSRHCPHCETPISIRPISWFNCRYFCLYGCARTVAIEVDLSKV
jgi:hypothetical protein